MTYKLYFYFSNVNTDFAIIKRLQYERDDDLMSIRKLLSLWNDRSNLDFTLLSQFEFRKIFITVDYDELNSRYISHELIDNGEG